MTQAETMYVKNLPQEQTGTIYSTTAKIKTALYATQQ